ncbi:hypothetical protein [Methanobrevibacter olleyae]|uniref:Uncharacterized protein n=1 Tax=Methanobrevibacter olleyae TaxID=294671 RepID=A0A126R056_METOL|nr:hypothetical protein [Methanobrevibacter olleyae]AMK15339.1 hypothetical protein YLM1_0782 [Methanobrevibacter olleyae]SFL30322.1 hypothetical protein SAMN02910297_00525 [Methanobrevibacter olleyae]
MTMKTASDLKFSDEYEYLTFDLNQEFLLGELEGEEIRDKMISAQEILDNHLENNYNAGDEIGIDNPFEDPILRKFIKINDVTDEMLDIIYYQYQINKEVYKFVTMTEPPVRGRILIKE